MITNFEEITGGLTDDEKKLIPIIVEGLKKRTRENPIKGPEIIDRINEHRNKYAIKSKLSEPRLRKLCNLIRSKGILPIIATSSGYYCSYDRIEILAQIKSLQERADAIINSANGLKKFLN